MSHPDYVEESDPDYDWGYEAQQVAEAHLSACHEALFAEQDADDCSMIPESPASAPFCGCDTCVVREVLYAAWPVFERAWGDVKPRPESKPCFVPSAPVPVREQKALEQ